MLNYYRKFEDIIFNIFADMTLQSHCIFLGTPGICVECYSVYPNEIEDMHTSKSLRLYDMNYISVICIPLSETLKELANYALHAAYVFYNLVCVKVILSVR